jgi:hypothetical protein
MSNSIQQNNNAENTTVKSEKSDRSWNFVSISSFVGAVALGVVRTVNDIRQQFMSSFVFANEGKGKHGFEKILSDYKVKFDKVINSFNA